MAARFFAGGLRKIRRHAAVSRAGAQRAGAGVTGHGPLSRAVSASHHEPNPVLPRADRFGAALEKYAPHRRAMHDPSWPETFTFWAGLEKRQR
jgi:hypothetical protein